MDDISNHHGNPAKRPRLGTPTSDDSTELQFAGQPTFHVARPEAGAVQEPGPPDISLHHVLASTSQQATPRVSVNPPPTPPRQRYEEFGPLDQQVTQYHQDGVPPPVLRLPSNAYLQAGYTPDHRSQALPTSLQEQIDLTGLPLHLPSIAELLQGPAYSIGLPSAPAVAPPGHPPIQNWSTHDLSSHYDKRAKTPGRPAKPYKNLSPEEQIQRKQENFNKKAALQRQKAQDRNSRAEAKRAAEREERNLSVPAPSVKKPKKRKANNMFEELLAPTPAPHQEGPALPVYASGARYPSNGYNNGYSHQLTQYLDTGFEDPYTQYYPYPGDGSGPVISQYATDPRQLYHPDYHLTNQQQFYQPTHYPPNLPQLHPPVLFPVVPPSPQPRPPPRPRPRPRPHQPQPLPPLSPPKPDHDYIPQPLTSNYTDYKWTITHFTLSPTLNFPYAQSFLDILLQGIFTSSPQPYKWHSHTTRGFIPSGTQLSLLVMHNAANPFTWDDPPTSTTSVGVYGRYWYAHEEIHWVTLAPDISPTLVRAQNQGIISVKAVWSPDMPPIQKRFHRAYWCAARMEPLGNLLRRGEGQDEDPEAVEEEDDDGFQISEEDLQTGWDEGVTAVKEEEAKVLWEKLLEDGQEMVPRDGCDHVFTGSSGMESVRLG